MKRANISFNEIKELNEIDIDNTRKNSFISI